MVRNVRASDAPMLEVGVLRGGTSAFLARAAGILKKKGRIFSCDTFSGHVERTPSSTAGMLSARSWAGRPSRTFATISLPTAVSRSFRETSRTLRPASARLLLLHLDVDVFETTRYVLDTFAERMVVGGVIIADDYAVKSCKGVKLAVDGFAAVATGVFISSPADRPGGDDAPAVRRDMTKGAAPACAMERCVRLMISLERTLGCDRAG